MKFSPETHASPALTAFVADGSIEPALVPCPSCGNQLRTEVRVDWRPLTRVADQFGYTTEEVRASGAEITPLGMVKCGVPYASCMHCGGDFDMSETTVLDS